MARNTMVIILKGRKNCTVCGKTGKKVRDRPNARGQDKGSGEDQASGSSDSSKKNRLCALSLGVSKRLLSTW